MFECVVNVELPIYPGEEREITSYRIASYDFDPGFQVGEKVQVNDASFFRNKRNGKRVRSPQAERFSFQAIVKERTKIIEPDVQLDSGEVIDQLISLIVLEVADKEQLPEISRIMREFEASTQTER
ncbi:hypothetical protein C7293_02415 [filamentous cyanobacterium CCT1]|nr:hypothetical protein C7293_02415 [filamentous cyanobacterium CCT1]PSN81641.1 hypothetical protein C8B47_00105 [filamentous cyanobacterium CCP4]